VSVRKPKPVTPVHWKLEAARSSKKMLFRRQAFRRRIALIALLGLLFQQWAMASYVCPLERGDVVGVATASVVPPCHSPTITDKTRCHQHCHPPAQTSDHASTPNFPPALPPATSWLRQFAAVASDVPNPVVCDIDVRATAPPLTIQYCTFQI
jgi:hypothetical protein